MNKRYHKANTSLDSLVAREVCHRLKETPKEYLDRVWEENPLEGPDDSGGSGSSGPGEVLREETREKKVSGKSPRTNEKWVSRTDPEASLVTRKGLAKPLLAHKVHIAVDGGRARIVTAEKPSPGGIAECSRPAPSHRQAHLQHPFPPGRSSGRPGLRDEGDLPLPGAYGHPAHHTAAPDLAESPGEKA